MIILIIFQFMWLNFIHHIFTRRNLIKRLFKVEFIEKCHRQFTYNIVIIMKYVKYNIFIKLVKKFDKTSCYFQLLKILTEEGIINQSRSNRKQKMRTQIQKIQKPCNNEQNFSFYHHGYCSHLNLLGFLQHQF